MKLIWLKLKNFRQFSGEQKTINFATDKDKMATFIFGESGFGKTTIIQAFKWVFYGETKYDCVLNGEIKDKLSSGQKEAVCVSICLSYKDSEYIIEREQYFQKNVKNVSPLEPTLKIDKKEADGTTKQFKGLNAQKIIKELMPKDLLKYFFLEGEDLDDYGEQITNREHTEFVNAVKGLLGFSHLHEAQSHLSILINNYRTKIQSISKDNRLVELIARIQRSEDTIKTQKEKIEEYEGQIIEYNRLANEKSDEIRKYAGVAEKQKRSLDIAKSLENLQKSINVCKRKLFSQFSKSGFSYLAQNLIEIGNETLTKENAMVKGIPGMEVDAIDYLLAQHRCVCGRELKEDTEEWAEMQRIKKFLPPNNFSTEIAVYKEKVRAQCKDGQNYYSSYLESLKNLDDLTREYNKLVDEQDELNKEIKGAPNVGSIKIQELEYREKATEFERKKSRAEKEIEDAEKEKNSCELEQRSYKSTDAQIELLTKYQDFAQSIYDAFVNFCAKRESIKREELQTAINDIFKEYYRDINVSLSLDDNYNVKLDTNSDALLADFVSGGQRVAVALAFIGAIIRLNSIKEKANDDWDISSTLGSEIYPLVLDAPTSNFGMKQMECFSDITPKVTDQLIVFVNDKDGPILKELMQDKIGATLSIEKLDTYNAKVTEGV